MKLVPWRKNKSALSPFRDFDSVFDEMNSFLSSPLLRYFDRDFASFEGAWVPEVDVRDLNDKIEVTADMPGLKKEDIDVSIHNNVLTIKGEKKQEREINNESGYIRSERSYGSFSRSITLPSEINGAKIEANYKDGVLNLVLPKLVEEKSKQIQINIK